MRFQTLHFRNRALANLSGNGSGCFLLIASSAQLCIHSEAVDCWVLVQASDPFAVVIAASTFAVAVVEETTNCRHQSFDSGVAVLVFRQLCFSNWSQSSAISPFGFGLCGLHQPAFLKYGSWQNL